MKLKQPSQERNKEFFLMVQTLFNQASLIVETNLFNYNTPSALDDLNKCEKFRSRTARMNTEGQSCLLDLIDTDQNQLAGCCGFIRVNRIEKEAQLVFIFYEQYIDYIEESIAYILKETLGILERLSFYDATEELQREEDNHPCYMRFVVDESARPGRRGDDQSSATGSVGEICRFWARGYCRFGEDCRYLHISAVPSGSLALGASLISQPGTPSLSSLGPPPSSPALSSLPGTGALGAVHSAVPAVFMPVSAVPGAGNVMGMNGSPLGGVRSNMLPPFYPATAYAPDASGGFESPQFAFPQYPYAPYGFPSFPYASYPWQQQMLGGTVGSGGIASGGDSGGFAQQQPVAYAPSQMMYGYSTMQQMQSLPFQQSPPQIQGQREDSAVGGNAGAASAMMYPPSQMMPLLAQHQAQQHAQQQAQQQAQVQGQSQDQDQHLGAAQPSDYMFYPSVPQHQHPHFYLYAAPQPQQQGLETEEEGPRPQDSSFSSCSTDNNPYYDAIEPPASSFPAGYPVGGYPAGVNNPYPQYAQQHPAVSYPSSIDGTEEHNMSQMSFSQSVSQSFSRSQDQEQRQDAGPDLKPDSSQDTSFDSGPREKTGGGAISMHNQNNGGGIGRGNGSENSMGGEGKPYTRAAAAQTRLPRSRSDDQSTATVVTGHVHSDRPASTAAATFTSTSTAAIAGMHQKLLDLVNTAPPPVLARLRYNEQHLLSSATTDEGASDMGKSSVNAAAASEKNKKGSASVPAEPSRAELPQDAHVNTGCAEQQQMDGSSMSESHYLTAQDLKSLNEYYQRMLNPAQYHNRFERVFTHGHFRLGADHSDGVGGDASRSDAAEATESSVTIHATPRAPIHHNDSEADNNNSTISSETSSSPSEEYGSEHGFEVHDATSEDFNSNIHHYQDMSPPDQPEGSWRERCEKGLSGQALSRQVQRREAAHRHHRLRYLLRALQMHRPRGPLNPADVIDLISPLCNSTESAQQGAERDDNTCVIDLTDLVALSMLEPHERCLHKKPGDTRSTAMELDLSTPSLAGSRRSAAVVASAPDGTNDNGYESDAEEEGDGDGDGDGESVQTQPAPYSSTTVAKIESKGESDRGQSSHKGANNITQSASQGKTAGRSFAIRQFSPSMVQCIVNGRAQNGPWPSLPLLLNAIGLSSAQRSVESLLFLNAGVVQAYCAERSGLSAQFHRLQMQRGQQTPSHGGEEVNHARRELQAAAQPGLLDPRQTVIPPQPAQMSVSVQQLQQRLLTQQQIFHQQQRQLQQQAPAEQQIPFPGSPAGSADHATQPFAMPPGGMHPQQLQYWMQQQQQHLSMQQFLLMQQQARVAAGADSAAAETSGTALSVANAGGAYAQRQSPQPSLPSHISEQRQEAPTKPSPAATAPTGTSNGPPEKLRPPPIQITPHDSSVPAPVVPPRAQYAPQPYPQYIPQGPPHQSAAGMSAGQGQVPQRHSAAPSEHPYNIRSTLAQQQQQQPKQRQPQEHERVMTSAGAASRPPPIYPRAAAPASTSTTGSTQPALLRSSRTSGTSSEPDSASQPPQQQQPKKKRKPRKSRDHGGGGGSGISVSGGSSGQDSPSPFPRAYPTLPATRAATSMEASSAGQQQRQGQFGSQQRQQQQQEQQMYYGPGMQGQHQSSQGRQHAQQSAGDQQPRASSGQSSQQLKQQQPAAVSASVPVRRPLASQAQQGEKRA